MTKVNKIGSDLLEFLDEDTGIAKTYKGSLAIEKFNELQAKAVDMSSQNKKSHDYTLGLFQDLDVSNSFNDDAFKDYVHRAGSKILKIETGRKVFNEAKYNAKVKARDDALKSLINKYNKIISNAELDLQTQERETSQIMREFNTLKQNVISRSENEFHETEFESIEMPASEALEIVRNIKSRYKASCDKDIENKLNNAIEADKQRFKDISEDDFQFIKRLHRLVDEKAFFNMFEYNPVYKYDALHYDSLEDYFNRDRDIKSDVKLELTNQEMSAVRYIYEIFKSYNTQCRSNKLKQDLSMMKQSLNGDHND